MDFYSCVSQYIEALAVLYAKTKKTEYLDEAVMRISLPPSESSSTNHRSL